MDLLNTHYYDGKINNCFYSNLSIDEKKNKGNELLSKISNTLARHFLTIIINDIGTANNIDNTNHINVDDLICHCWEYKDNEDFLREFEIQLLDMATGFCPQGRTHRVYQVLLAFV
jgi:hypothetical protein